jgi:hypothetical protein
LRQRLNEDPRGYKNTFSPAGAEWQHKSALEDNKSAKRRYGDMASITSKTVDTAKRRMSLGTILERLSLPGEVVTLSGFDKDTLCEILRQIDDGHDVRKYLGIKPMRRRKATFDRKEQIAIHYWALRDHPPREKPAIARRRVAEVWGCDETRVGKYAVRHKSKARALASLGTLDTHLAMARCYANSHHHKVVTRLKEHWSKIKKRSDRFVGRLQSASLQDLSDAEVTALEAEAAELNDALALIETELQSREAGLERATSAEQVFKQTVRDLRAEVHALRVEMDSI